MNDRLIEEKKAFEEWLKQGNNNRGYEDEAFLAAYQLQQKRIDELEVRVKAQDNLIKNDGILVMKLSDEIKELRKENGALKVTVKRFLYVIKCCDEVLRMNFTDNSMILQQTSEALSQQDKQGGV